jgi:predicted DNA-binding protein (UPF0251 family)
VVIQITPQTELANSLTGEARSPGESSEIRNIHEQGGESPHKPKAEKSRLGVFAQILSGLRKTGAGEKAAGERKPEALSKTSNSDGLQPVQKANNNFGKGLAKAEGAGETEPELQLQAAGLSAQEKNILFGAGYLAGEFKDEYSELTDKEVAVDSVVSLGRPNGREATEEEAVQIDMAGLEAARGKPTAEMTTGKSGEDVKISAVSPEKTAEKAKNRFDIATKGETAAAETPLRGGYSRRQRKKQF